MDTGGAGRDLYGVCAGVGGWIYEDRHTIFAN